MVTATVSDGGRINTGTGGTTIHDTGSLINDGGQILFNGGLTIDGGSFMHNSGSFGTQEGTTIHVLNNGVYRLNVTVSLSVTRNIDVNLQSGGQRASAGGLRLGTSTNGTVTVYGGSVDLDISAYGVKGLR